MSSVNGICKFQKEGPACLLHLHSIILKMPRISGAQHLFREQAGESAERSMEQDPPGKLGELGQTLEVKRHSFVVGLWRGQDVNFSGLRLPCV